MATFMDKLNEGMTFEVFGSIGETMSFPDRETGELHRFVKIVGFGKTYSLEVGSDEELGRYKSMEGRMVKAYGGLGRRRGALSATARIKGVSTSDDKDWKEPSVEEILEGCRFSGWGLVTKKAYTEYQGKTYRKLQVGTMGETYLFKDLEPEMFGRMPETGPIKVSGTLETDVVSTNNGQIADLRFVVKEFSVPEASRRTVPQEPASQDKKTA